MMDRCRICFQKMYETIGWKNILILPNERLLCETCYNEFQQAEAKEGFVFKKSAFTDEVIGAYLEQGDYILAEVLGSLLRNKNYLPKIVYISKPIVNERIGYHPEIELLKFADVNYKLIDEEMDQTKACFFTVVELEEDEKDKISKECTLSRGKIYFTALFEK
jgi:hypothetical protein